MADVATFFGELVKVIYNLLVTPAATTLTPLQVIMWSGLILGFLVFVVSLIKRLSSQS